MMGVGLQQYLLEWWAAVLSLPQILRRLAFKARTVDEELQEATAKGSLKRALSFWDLLALVRRSEEELVGTCGPANAWPPVHCSCCPVRAAGRLRRPAPAAVGRSPTRVRARRRASRL